MKFLPACRLLFGLILPFFLAACSKKEKPLEMNDRTGRGIRVEPIIAMPTTAMTVLPLRNYDAPFFLDSLYNNYAMTYTGGGDTLHADGDINVFFPQSAEPKHAPFNKAIRGIVDQFIAAYKPEQQVPYTYMSAAMWIQNFGINRDIAHAVFVYQSYFEGAAHYNHGREILNYDFSVDRKIGLNEIILFENEKDKQLFCDAYNPAPYHDGTLTVIMLEPSDFSAEQDFGISNDGIYLYFDDGEKTNYLSYHFIPYEKIRGYVNPKYRHYFE
jgi:hypothetical protein